MTPYFSKTIFKFKQWKWSFATVKCFWLFLFHKKSAPPPQASRQPGLTCPCSSLRCGFPDLFPTYVQHDWSYWGDRLIIYRSIPGERKIILVITIWLWWLRLLRASPSRNRPTLLRKGPVAAYLPSDVFWALFESVVNFWVFFTFSGLYGLKIRWIPPQKNQPSHFRTFSTCLSLYIYIYSSKKKTAEPLWPSGSKTAKLKVSQSWSPPEEAARSLRRA